MRITTDKDSFQVFQSLRAETFKPLATSYLLIPKSFLLNVVHVSTVEVSQQVVTVNVNRTGSLDQLECDWRIGEF